MHRVVCLFKPAFHDADILADILARIFARMSACRSACHRNNSAGNRARVGRVGEDPREDVGVGVVECELYAPRFCQYHSL